MSIAPSLFSSDETHCCALKRQENICCTCGLFFVLDYQVYTLQHCPGISNALTQELLQDTAENMKCNHNQLLPKTPPCSGVTSHAGCPTLDVEQLLCQLAVKQKSLQKFKLSDLLSTTLLLNTPHYQGTTGSTPGWHLQCSSACDGTCALWHFPQGNSFLWSCPGRKEVSMAAQGVQ